KTQRWGSSVVLMIVDAAFTSIGLNYFRSVVPAVERFERQFADTGRVASLTALARVDAGDADLRRIWRNRRSWQMARLVATYLVGLGTDEGLGDRGAFIRWAKSSKLVDWRNNPVGTVIGVGINTYQYLRMMGGVDTVMPDKVVRSVVGEMIGRAGIEIPADDIAFVRLTHQIAARTGYRPIEICWMTWLIQSEAGVSRTQKYSAVLSKI
ncbi:MAG: hypothetical protein V1737_00980, partial [Chloroflexota bacterium]